MPTVTSRPTVPEPMVFNVRVTGTDPVAPPSVAVDVPETDASALSLSWIVKVWAVGLPKLMPSAPVKTTLLTDRLMVSGASTRWSSVGVRETDLLYTRSPLGLRTNRSPLLKEMVVVGNEKSAPLVAVPPVVAISALTVPFRLLSVVTRVMVIGADAPSSPWLAVPANWMVPTAGAVRSSRFSTRIRRRRGRCLRVGRRSWLRTRRRTKDEKDI